MAAEQIINQAATAMLTQANSMDQAMLKLID
jgi:flagellin-like hook-associated protein FlgL